MKLEDYMMTSRDVAVDEVDLDGLNDSEKQSILKVLQRNNKVRFTEERRLQQLAVRIQIQRMTDQRTLQDETTIKTKTGEWHRDLVRKRSRGRSLDVSSTLYRRISIDLINVESRRLPRDRSSLCSSPSSSRPSVNSRMSSPQNLDEDWEGTADDIKGSFFKSTLSEDESAALAHSLSRDVGKLKLKQREI